MKCVLATRTGAELLLRTCCTPTLSILHMHAGSYASWVAGDNLAPATETAGTGAGSSGKHPPLRKSVSGFAANGGAATMAVRKVAAALKVRLLHTLEFALLKRPLLLGTGSGICGLAHISYERGMFNV